MGYRRIDTVTKSKAVELLRSRWRPDAVADRSHVCRQTGYNWQKRLEMYETPHLPPGYTRRAGRSHQISTAAKESLLEYQRRHSYVYQDELALFLEEEWEIYVHKSTVCRLLRKERITRKQSELIGPRSQPLRTKWQAKMLDVTAEQLIFCDESIFKAQLAWRCMSYGPIGEACRWNEDMRRGNTYSILPAYTVDGYLPCTDIKEGFFNGEDFFQ